MGACMDPGPPLYNCKILKLSTKKYQGCYQAAPSPLPPPPKKKKNPGSAYGRLTIHALIPCMDSF